MNTIAWFVGSVLLLAACKISNRKLIWSDSLMLATRVLSGITNAPFRAFLDNSYLRYTRTNPSFIRGLVKFILNASFHSSSLICPSKVILCLAIGITILLLLCAKMGEIKTGLMTRRPIRLNEIKQILRLRRAIILS